MRQGRKTNKNGFTFIEMLIALAIIGICFAPLSRMFMESVQETLYLGDMLTAMGLARREMEQVKNPRVK